MIIKVNEERNFFLFQDIVYFFLLTLNNSWRLPMENKHSSKKYPFYGSNYYIYQAWFDIFAKKLYNCGLTDYGKQLVDANTSWMVTTNIAILEAQKQLGKERFNKYDEEYLEKNKPYFLIELTDNYQTYIVHLDDEMKVLFNEAVSFWGAFEQLEVERIYNQLRRYFEITEVLKNELAVIVNNFVPTENRYFDSVYEIVEE